MPNDSTAYERPPAAIKDVYKIYQKLDKLSLDARRDLVDLSRPGDDSNHPIIPSGIELLPAELRKAFLDFQGMHQRRAASIALSEPPRVFKLTSVPGLFIYPSLLPPEVQVSLLDRLLHRDLCNLEHKTNVHLYHHVPYPPISYFDPPSQELIFQPKDSAIHKSFTTQQFLDKKLRWMTLGGQYDWTNKVYPSDTPPPFPADIKRLIEDIFPMKAEAAIVNIYSPGDTLSLHRDVSEECDQPLLSISIGCDGIFVVGLDGSEDSGEPRVATIRLGSGDAVLMSGESRFAWHGVPKVLEGTCPEWLRNWPFDPTNEDLDCSNRFGHWQEWMNGKRINLNVRQMFA